MAQLLSVFAAQRFLVVRQRERIMGRARGLAWHPGPGVPAFGAEELMRAG